MKCGSTNRYKATKRCVTCQIQRSTNYSRTKKGREGLARYQKKYQAKPEVQIKLKRNNRKYYYGISDKEYQRMLFNQKGICSICERKLDPPCVDHDHKTGKVRGLLCGKCNTAIGYFSDNTTSLRNAITYLETY